MQDHQSDHPDAAEQPTERVLRRRTLKKAVASYSGGAISMEVVIRDFSENGAKLKLKENDILPDHFSLYVDIDGARVDCEAVWRRGLEVGVRFVSEIVYTRAIRKQALRPTMHGKKVSLRKKPITG